VVKLHVVNWRCIDEVEIELKPITVLLGRNATGKSSLAYAAYLLARAPERGNITELLERLYGTKLDEIVRIDRGKRMYPVVIEADGYSFKAENPQDYVSPQGSPWRTGYLMPSIRIGVYKALVKSIMRLVESEREERIAALLISPLFTLIAPAMMSPPALLFIEDLLKALGIKTAKSYEVLGGLGKLTVHISPFTLLGSNYDDPYVGHSLSASLAPEGALDSGIIEVFLEGASEGSLLVIEEPEIHKNPLLLLDFIAHIAEVAKDKSLTVIMTTHSDLVVHGLAKMVEEKRLEPRDVAIYYLERSKDSPWTRVRELKVYEDGTVEELPGVEEVIARLF